MLKSALRRILGRKVGTVVQPGEAAQVAGGLPGEDTISPIYDTEMGQDTDIGTQQDCPPPGTDRRFYTVRDRAH